MARITHGLMGHISGKVGNLVFSSWRGIEYVRSLGKKSASGCNSAPQNLHRAKFALVSRFLSSFSGLLEFSFPEYRAKQTPMNRAFSLVLSNGILVENSKPQLNYPEIMVAKGNLVGALKAGALSRSPGKVEFFWANHSGDGIQLNLRDKVILVVYCPSLAKAAWTITTSDRTSNHACIDVTFDGKEVHTWLSFIREDLRDVSDSMYAGRVMVEEWG